MNCICRSASKDPYTCGKHWRFDAGRGLVMTTSHDLASTNSSNAHSPKLYKNLDILLEHYGKYSGIRQEENGNNIAHGWPG